MSLVSHEPTLLLSHVQFYEDCTVGRLSDGNGQLLCMTLEPRWRDKRTRRDAQVPACLRAADYHVSFHYDETLRYACWHLSGRTLRSKVRLCFLAKSGSVAAHTKGDLLLGYLCPEGDEEQPFTGRLYRPVEAYERLYDYFVSLRANHGDFLLRVEPTMGPVTFLPAVEAPALSPDLVRLEDYILQTL